MPKENKKLKIGFIGQGWIGKNYADDFDNRGFDTIRYSLEEPYVKNGDKIKQCDVVFIAVPTPTTKNGFDGQYVRSAITRVGKGKIAVIKSTILPKTTELIQKENPNILVMHSPEFLREKTAAYDAGHPDRNIVGIPVNSQKYKNAAKKVLGILPKAPFELICSSREAELIKYAGNNFLYLKVIYANMLYDTANALQCDWKNVMEALGADPRIGVSHLQPLDKQGGRGAGGNCFIKDFSAFAIWHKEFVKDLLVYDIFEAVEKKNMDLLIKSKKDMDIIKDVYGK